MKITKQPGSTTLTTVLITSRVHVALVLLLVLFTLFCLFLFFYLVVPQLLGLICWAFAIEGPVHIFAFKQAPIFTLKNVGVFVWIEGWACPWSEPFHFWRLVIGTNALWVFSVWSWVWKKLDIRILIR